MFLRNTSPYPLDEVKALIKLAAESYDLRYVCVNVKGSKTVPFAGYAYRSVPRAYSNAPRTAKYLVTLRIGTPEKFTKPASNVNEKWGWVAITEEEHDAHIREQRGGVVRDRERYVRGIEQTVFERWEKKAEARTYGGSRSPVITYHCWREALVGVAAHEFHHILQFQNRMPAAEYRCELAAARALEKYREKNAEG